jgi:hypothetical protein
MLRYALALFIAIWACVPALAAASGGKDAVAVIIGNRDYAAPVPDVDFAHNDAEAMKRFLVDRLGFRAGNILDLRDATQAQLASAFGNERGHKAKLWGMVRQGRSDVVVFYSGHGVPGRRDGRSYLLPVDADPDTPEFNGYPLDLLFTNLAKLEARSVTVYLDACFSGESPKGRLVKSASNIGLSPVPEKRQGGITVIAAARGDQLASWDEEARHGLFTRYLLKGLYGAADGEGYGDGDGDVTLAELRAFLDDEMSYAARRMFLREQQAAVSGKDGLVLASLPEGRAAEPPAIAAKPLKKTGRPPRIVPLAQEMVAVARAAVRARPGATEEMVDSLQPGEVVTVTGLTEDTDWFRIARADGRVGFVLTSRLAEKSGAAATPAGDAMDEARRAYKSGDYRTAYRIWRRLAEAGHAEAQFELALVYSKGRGVTKNLATGFEWFRKAAAQGHAVAQYNLGVALVNGYGVARNHAEAVAWFRKAADQGYDDAMVELGLQYLKGQGVAQSYVTAARWFRKAAEKGYARGQALLGSAYLNGEGVPRDEAKAYFWLSLAADQGFALATSILQTMD